LASKLKFFGVKTRVVWRRDFGIVQGRFSDLGRLGDWSLGRWGKGEEVGTFPHSASQWTMNGYTVMASSLLLGKSIENPSKIAGVGVNVCYLVVFLMKFA